MGAAGHFGPFFVLFLLAVHVQCRPVYNDGDESEQELLVAERLLVLLSQWDQSLPTRAPVVDGNEYENAEIEHEKKEIEQIENFLKTNNLEVPEDSANDNVHTRLDKLVAVLKKNLNTVFLVNGKARKVAPSTVGDYLPSREVGVGIPGTDDMKLLPEQMAAMNGTVDKRRTVLRKPWTNNFIPYEFDIKTLPSTTTHALIRQAMDDWESAVCIAFRPRVASDNTWLTIGSYGGCWSYVGEVGRKGQKVSIDRGCEHRGIIQHEFGHSMGFFHEQSRQDREEHITVHFKNILPGQRGNFRKANTGIHAAYDVTSIMHYGRSSFTKNGKPTITTIHPDENVLIGNREGFAFYDIKVANSFYQCAAACSNQLTPPPTCENTGFLDKHSCTKCKCPEGLGGSTCSEIDPSWTFGGTCGNVIDLDLDPVFIQTPNFFTTGAYGAGNRCAWLIKTSRKDSVVVLKILSLDTNSKSTDDHIEVRKNLPGQTGIFFRGDTATVTETSKPLYTVTTKMNGFAQMTVLFSSSPNGTPGRGFMGQVLVKKITVCFSSPCSMMSDCVLDSSSSTGFKCVCQRGVSGPNCDIIGDLVVRETFEGAEPFLFTVDDWLLNSGTTPSKGTGPDGDSEGNGGSYLYYETSTPRIPWESVKTNSTVFFEGSVQRCLIFAYHMYGGSMGHLNVNLEINGRMTKPLFDVVGNMGNMWHMANVVIPPMADTIYKIVFEGIRGMDFQSDIAIDAIDVTVCNGKSGPSPATGKRESATAKLSVATSSARSSSPCSSAPCHGMTVCVVDGSLSNGYKCVCRQGITGQNCDVIGNLAVSETFESAPFLFTDDDWLLNWGPTPSTGTGPDDDFSANGGSYLYYETTSPKVADAMAKSTVLFQGSVQRCLIFAFHMYGKAMGTLNVKLEIDDMMTWPLFSITGDHHNIWHVANVTIPVLTGQLYKIVFEGIRGTGYTSDMAIDAINVTVCDGSSGRSTPSPTPTTTRRPTPTTTPRPATSPRPNKQPVSVYTDEISCDFEEDLSKCLLSNKRQDRADFVRSDGCTVSGPCGDHTTLFGNGYYLILRPRPTLPSDMGTLVGPWLLFDAKQVCIGGFFYIYGDAFAQFKIEPLRQQGKEISGPLIDFTTPEEWLAREATVGITGAFRLLIIAGVDTEYSSVAMDDIYIRPGSCDLTPTAIPTGSTTPMPKYTHELLFDNFDTTASVFSGEIGYFQWTRHSGPTPSFGTGPAADTSGNGHFMYTEASRPREKGDVFKMHSSKIQTYTPDVCLEFMLCDFGSGMGSLNVTIKAATSNQVYGSICRGSVTLTINSDLGDKHRCNIDYFLPTHLSQQEEWQRVQINARPNYADIKIVFEVTKGDSWSSDYAVDDVDVYSGPCA